MEALSLCSVSSFCDPPAFLKNHFTIPPKFLNFHFNDQNTSRSCKMLFTTLSSSSSPSTPAPAGNLVPAGPQVEADTKEKKFDWYAHWYPVMPVCDLDKGSPHAKKVLGLDVVGRWDRNESAWRVFGDTCPHRLASLSDGRIDGKGRLQCVYHGWCFNGFGDRKFIPQAPPNALR